MPSQLDFTPLPPRCKRGWHSLRSRSRPVGASSFVVAGDSGTAVDSAPGPRFQQTVLITSGGTKCHHFQDLTGERRLSLQARLHPEAFTPALVGWVVGRRHVLIKSMTEPSIPS